jgi:hypothetical protein
MGCACSTRCRPNNLYKIVVVKLERNRPIGRHMIKCEDNIKIDCS